MSRKKIFNSIICISTLLFFVLVILSCLWWESQEKERQKGLESNSSYADYECRDCHLKCLEEDETKGQYYKEVGDTQYRIRYRCIEDISDEILISAEIYEVMSLADSRYVILQEPKNMLNIVKDWTIEEISLYCSDLSQSIARTTEEVVKQDIKEFLDNVENAEVNETGKEETEMYLRLSFEESKAIVWDSSIKICKGNEGIVITTEIGRLDQFYKEQLREVIINPESELYKFIYNAYIGLELTE